MTAFLALCVISFGATVLIDMDDLVKEASVTNWVFLIFSTGMLVFAAHALWEHF